MSRRARALSGLGAISEPDWRDADGGAISVARPDDRAEPRPHLRRPRTHPAHRSRGRGTHHVLHIAAPSAAPAKATGSSLRRRGRSQASPFHLPSALPAHTKPLDGRVPDHTRANWAAKSTLRHHHRGSGARERGTTSRRRTFSCRTRRRNWASSRRQKRAPDQAFHLTGALPGVHLSHGVKCRVTPDMSHCYPTSDQLFRGISGPRPGSCVLCAAVPPLPPSHRLLDQAVGMVPRLGQKLGVVAEENLDALSGAARTLCRVDTGGKPE